MAKTIKGTKKADTITVNANNAVVVTGRKTVKTAITKSGNNKIFADKGNDVIYVKGGKNNNLYGGAGKDTFVLGKKGSAVIKDYKAGQDTVKINSGIITSTKLSGKDVIFNAGNASLTLEGSANSTISLKDERGSYTVSKSKIKLGKDFSGTMNATKYLSTVKTLDGRNTANAVNIIGNAKDNIIYANKRGGTVRGGAGRDTYVLAAFTAKTNLAINQSGSKFGDMDILQLKNVKKSDVKYSLKGTKLIITHKNGGKITVSNWNKRPLSEIQFVNSKTKTITNYDINEEIKNYDYATITKSGTYKATNGNDKFIVSKKSSFNKNVHMKIGSTDDTDGPVISENGNVETINGFPVTKTVVISDLGTEGIDSLDLTSPSFTGAIEYYLEGKDMILPMLEEAGVVNWGNDDTITKIILKDFAAEDRILELREFYGNSEPRYLIVNTGKVVQGTNGSDYISVSKNGQSVFSNGGNHDDVQIRGYDNNKVVFSKDNEGAYVNIHNGNYNVVKANGAKGLYVWLDLGSTYNTVIGAGGIGVQISDNNRIHGSAGDDQLSIYSGTNNTVYGEEGNDHILITANGNKFYGGAGKDVFEITDFELYNSSHKTDIIYDYKLGADTIQVSNSSIIADRVISGSDIVLNLRGGGAVNVLGAVKKGINVLDSSTGKTFNIKDSNYVTISESGIHEATDGNDTFIFSGNGSKDVLINGLGVKGDDSLDVSSYNGSVGCYQDGNNLVFSMTDDDNNTTKITLKDFTVTDQNVKLIDLAGVGYEPKHLIASTGNTVQGTNGDDIIYVTKNGQSVFSNSGWLEDVYINGYNNTTVNFSKDNGYAFVSLKNGDSTVINANGAESLVAWLENASNNTVTGATGIHTWMSGNNQFYCSAGNDEINIAEGSTNNTVYCEAGDDHIYINANGNEFYGGDGKDLFDIGWFESNGGTDIIYDYEFGTDTLQVSDSNVIAGSEISGSDVLLNLSNGGSVKVIGAATNGINILDSSTGKTFSL